MASVALLISGLLSACSFFEHHSACFTCSTQLMVGGPGNITRPRAKSAIQKTIMADEMTSSVSKVSCLKNDRNFSLVSLLYSWYLTFDRQGCFLIKKSTAKSPRKRSAGLNCNRFEARGFKHTAHASFPCFQTTLKRFFIPCALLPSPYIHPDKNAWQIPGKIGWACLKFEPFEKDVIFEQYKMQTKDWLQTIVFSVRKQWDYFCHVLICMVKTTVCSNLQSAFCGWPT